MNLITELQKGKERGLSGHPSAAKPEQVDQLLEEIKEFVEQLKAERGKAKKAESREGPSER
ncbi:MAG TPA: hypothetical protein VKF17_01705 [Isosphaeraceae bacterium]|nr:hypothetical protein [Isosphaeraceae bacterium]